MSEQSGSHLGMMIAEQAERYRGQDQLALRHRVSGEWEELTYEGLGALAQQAARALVALGVAEAAPLDAAMEFGGGSPLVGIFSANRMEAVAVDYACALCRAVAMPLYPALSTPDFDYIMAHSGVKLLLVDDWTRYRKVLALLKEDENLEHIIVIDPEVRLKKDPRMMSWADFLAQGEGEELKAETNRRFQRSSPDDIAALNYTPGTTGEPKGVLLTHRAMLAAAGVIGRAGMPQADEIRLSLLPQALPFERASCYLAHMGGARVDLCHDAEAIPVCLQESQPHYMNSLPRMWEKIHSALLMGMELAKGYRQRFFRRAMATGAQYRKYLREDKNISPWLNFRYMVAHQFLLIKIQATFGGRLKQCCCVGAALEPVVEEFFISAGIDLLPAYSLTEYPAASVATPGEPGFGACGAAAADIKITKEQEIWLRGAAAAVGYYRDPALTIRNFDKKGWFKSGDRGLTDAHGQVTVLGRMARALFLTPGGHAMAPEQIEKRLKGDYYIEDISITPAAGGGICAQIVPNFDGLKFYFSQQGKSHPDHAAMLNDPEVLLLYYRRWHAAVPEIKDIELVILSDPFTVEGGELNPLLLKKVPSA
ncbi:MAG: AMP-binding protein [Syntrophomonadaceae bacterium]|nr:AMP-binding protein [Syntrophomonadaceae bacterium]